MTTVKKAFLMVVAVAMGVSLITAANPSGVQVRKESGGIKVTILYDNYLHTEGLETGWGFSCLIEGTDKTILFDTGAQGEILWHNLEKLGVDINTVEAIVLSHNHGDHTGGLFSILETTSGVPVYMPISFPETFVQQVESAGGEAVRVGEPFEICKDVILTGEISGPVNEQALILNTDKGPVVITGCAHPGIVGILNKSTEITKKKVYFTFGGFHLINMSEGELEDIINQFRKLGLEKCGATHCTGDRAIELFKEAFGANYVPMGVGRIIIL